jgi:hypothetical protein
MIAFCFLLIDKLEYRKIWEDFFSEAPPGTYSLYSHIKHKTNETPDWLLDRGVRTKTVPTGWCGEGLVKAFNGMLKKALKNKTNTHFCLLSGSCIPLYNYRTTYDKIAFNRRSMMSILSPGGESDYFVLLDDHDVYYADQWSILTRPVAKTLIRLNNPKDIRAQNFLINFKKKFEKIGSFFSDTDYDYDPDSEIATNEYGEEIWSSGCPDELYPINWFIKIYGKPSSKKFQKYIENRTTTYTKWDGDIDSAHPLRLTLKQTRCLKKEICSGNGIFGRKFDSEAAIYISEKCN